MKSSSVNIYSLSESREMHEAEGAQARPIRLLQAQIHRGFRKLYFARPLEADFCHFLRVSGGVSRASLILVALLGMFAIILIDQPVLGVPDVLFAPTRMLELGLMVPITLACGLFCWYWPHSRHIEAVMLILFAAMNIGMTGQRIISSRYGFDVPVELLGVSIVAMFALARIRFWLMLPAAIVAFTLCVLVEVFFVTADRSAYYHLFSTVLLLTVGVMGGYYSEYFIRWTWLNGTMLHYMSRLDSLTGLLNRQSLEDALEKAIAHAHREKLDYAVVMIDIDAFGAYNDHYGHQAGDDALSEVASCLEGASRRPMDVCGRFGGEEFALLWVGGDELELVALAERTRVDIEKRQIKHRVSNIAPWVTASVGLCYVSVHDERAPVEEVLAMADRLLYEAKARGRNRVVSGRFADLREPRQVAARRASG